MEVVTASREGKVVWGKRGGDWEGINGLSSMCQASYLCHHIQSL